MHRSRRSTILILTRDAARRPGDVERSAYQLAIVVFEMKTLIEEIAVPIPLQLWQDPQGDLVLKRWRSGCSVYFGCWIDAGEPADFICELSFDHTWAVRGYNSEYLPYRIGRGQTRSNIFEIEFSTWLKQASEQRERCYPNWRDWDKKDYHHYIVQGHDNYYEILAAGYTERQIPYDEAGELKRLVDEA